MIGATEIAYSLALVDKARKRLAYQRAAIERLGFHSEPGSAALVRDMCSAMQAKLDALELRHANLTRGL